MRFISKQYPTYFGFNGMIGFLVRSIDISENIKRINALCREKLTKKKTTSAIMIDKEAGYYKSTHINHITEKEITLYHLMADLSDVIKG